MGVLRTRQIGNLDLNMPPSFQVTQGRKSKQKGRKAAPAKKPRISISTPELSEDRRRTRVLTALQVHIDGLERQKRLSPEQRLLLERLKGIRGSAVREMKPVH